MITLYVALPNGGVVSYFSPELDRTLAIDDALHMRKKVEVDGSSWTMNEIGQDGSTTDITEEARGADAH